MEIEDEDAVSAPHYQANIKLLEREREREREM
jgi:hypothetical protein